MYTKERAKADVARMTGWINPRVVVEREPAIDGSEIVYILAESEGTGLPVGTYVWDSPEQEAGRRL